MKVGSLTALLRDFEALVEAAGGSKALQHIRELQGLFAGHENSTVAQFASRLSRGKESYQSAGTSQPIQRLQHVLTKLQALLISANGRQAASDIQALIGLLDGCDHASIDEFAEQAKGWAVLPSKRKPSLPKADGRKASSGEDLRHDLARGYADELRRASNDNSAFDQTVERLRRDKKVRTQEMREIAKTYLGYDIAKKKGRDDALAEIINRQALDARQEARGRSLDRLKSW